MYETLILCGFAFILLFFALPETNAEYILGKRAQRLRLKTGDDSIKTRSEIHAGGKDWLKLTAYHLTMPFKITILDPSVLFINLYTGLVYCIYVSSLVTICWPIILTKSTVLLLRILPPRLPRHVRLQHRHNGCNLHRRHDRCRRRLSRICFSHILHLRAIHLETRHRISRISSRPRHFRCRTSSSRYVHIRIRCQTRDIVGCADRWHRTLRGLLLRVGECHFCLPANFLPKVCG